MDVTWNNWMTEKLQFEQEHVIDLVRQTVEHQVNMEVEHALKPVRKRAAFYETLCLVCSALLMLFGSLMESNNMMGLASVALLVAVGLLAPLQRQLRRRRILVHIEQTPVGGEWCLGMQVACTTVPVGTVEHPRQQEQ